MLCFAFVEQFSGLRILNIGIRDRRIAFVLNKIKYVFYIFKCFDSHGWASFCKLCYLDINQVMWIFVANLFESI